jgi:hypothetical protein
MCICWCVTEINYKMHGATIKIQNIIVSLVRMGQRKVSDMFISGRYSFLLWTQSTFLVPFLYDPTRHFWKIYWD